MLLTAVLSCHWEYMTKLQKNNNRDEKIWRKNPIK